MKKTIVSFAICLFAILATNSVNAQAKTVYLPSFEKLIKGKTLVSGLNLIYTTEGGSKVYANKVAGQEISFLIKDAGGTVIPPVNQTTTQKGKRTCWHCVEEPNGDVNCFEVGCPKIIKTSTSTTH